MRRRMSSSRGLAGSPFYITSRAKKLYREEVCAGWRSKTIAEPYPLEIARREIIYSTSVLRSDRGDDAASKERERRFQIGTWYRSGTFLRAGIPNLKTLTLIVAGYRRLQISFLAFFGAVAELQGSLMASNQRSSRSARQHRGRVP
jgi:hypothetical protein